LKLIEGGCFSQWRERKCCSFGCHRCSYGWPREEERCWSFEKADFLAYFLLKFISL
jgi:hypothetical protein